jgi:hypothetical protein
LLVTSCTIDLHDRGNAALRAIVVAHLSQFGHPLLQALLLLLLSLSGTGVVFSRPLPDLLRRHPLSTRGLFFVELLSGKEILGVLLNDQGVAAKGSYSLGSVRVPVITAQIGSGRNRRNNR